MLQGLATLEYVGPSHVSSILLLIELSRFNKFTKFSPNRLFRVLGCRPPYIDETV